MPSNKVPFKVPRVKIINLLANSSAVMVPTPDFSTAESLFNSCKAGSRTWRACAEKR